MIVIGIYHRFFNLMEQSHPLRETTSIDILTARESCALVNGFSRINGNHCMNKFTYQNNCYLLFICKAITRFITDTYHYTDCSHTW